MFGSVFRDCTHVLNAIQYFIYECNTVSRLYTINILAEEKVFNIKLNFLEKLSKY